MDLQGVETFSSRCVGGRLPVAVCVYGERLKTAYPSALSSQSAQGDHTITLHHHHHDSHPPTSLATSQLHTLDSGAAHRNPIQAMGFSSTPPSAPLYLCSASQDSTILWQMAEG